MQQELLERIVLSSLETFEDLNHLRDRGISETSFVVHQEIFLFIEEFSREYEGKMPSKAVLQAQFEFQPEDAQDNIDWYISKLVEVETTRKVEEIIEKGLGILVEEEKPTEALDFLIEGLSETRPQRTFNKSLTDAEAMKRLDQYLQRVEEIKQGRLPGIPTGIRFLDSNDVSWLPGQLIGILGSTKKGKSWMSLYMACIAYALGYRVLYFSPELSIPEVEARWDTIMAKIMGCEFSNMSLLMGHSIDVATYRDWLEVVAKRSDWLTVTSDTFKKPLTLDVIETQTHKFKPDVVVVDGVYLLKGRAKTDNWEKIMDIIYGLKALATSRNIVVMASNQLQRAAHEKENPDLSEVGYSWAFAQAVDKCLIISKPEGNIADNIRIIRLTGVRSGVDLPPQEVLWDVDKGIIGHPL